MTEIVGLVIKVPANTVTKKPTDYLNVDVDYSYRGPAQRVYFTAVVTQETWWGEFDEIGSTRKQVYIDLPESDTFKNYRIRVSSLPLSGVEPKTTLYGVKVKAEGTFGTVEAGNKACLYITQPIGEAYLTSATPDRSSIYAGETFYITVGVKVEKANIYSAHLDGITGSWSSYHNACRFDGVEVTPGPGLGIGTLAPGSYTFTVPVTISKGVWAPGYVYQKCMIARLMYGDRPGLPGPNSVASYGSPIIITFYT